MAVKNTMFENYNSITHTVTHTKLEVFTLCFFFLKGKACVLKKPQKVSTSQTTQTKMNALIDQSK